MKKRKGLEDKVWLLSYPRSGNTWMRFLLANLLYPYPDQEVNFNTLQWMIPNYRNALKRLATLNLEDTIRIVRSHYLTIPEYRKVIYIYRDGRDVARSQYLFEKEDKEKFSFEEYLQKGRWNRGRKKYSSWKTHVRFWVLNTPKDISTILIKYEELYSNPQATLKKIVDFLNWDATDKMILQAIENSTYNNMSHTAINIGTLGKPGGWKDFFTQKQLDIFWNVVGDLAEKLEYKREWNK